MFKVDIIEINEDFDIMLIVVGFFLNIVEGDVYIFKG